MRTIEYRGTLDTTSSLAHTDRATGTTHGFRRETLLLPTGAVLGSLPVLSGGVIRGSLRRVAAVMAQEAITADLDDARLPFSVVHALRTGGALRETRSAEEVLTGEKQARLRDLIPMLSIFGFSTSGRIVSGRLDVDKALPLAQETAHLAPQYGVETTGYTLPSVWTLIQRETYTRHADVLNATAQPYIETTPDEERVISKGAGNMLWAQETLISGTRLLHALVLSEASPVEVSFMDELLTRWARKGRVGAQRGRGMGRITPRYERLVTDVLGDPAEEEPGASWREHTAAHHDEVRDILALL